MNKQSQSYIRQLQAKAAVWRCSQKNRLAACLLLCTVVFYSCNKDRSSEFIPDPSNPGNDTNWYMRPAANASVFQLDTLFCDTPFSDSVTIATGGAYRIANGPEVVFPPNFCDAAASPSGKLRVQIVYLKKKGDFIRFARPTSNSDKLISAVGACNIILSYNGRQVALKPNTIVTVRFPASLVAPPPIQVFSGDTNASSYPGDFNWVAVTDNSIPIQAFQEFDQVTNTWITGYELQVKNLSWLAAGYSIDDITPAKVKLSVLLPANFTNANTAVYAVFKGSKTVLRLKADPGSKSFAFANIPKGTAVSIIAIAKIGSTLYWAQDDELIVLPQIVKLKPEQKTAAQISSLLDAL